MTLSDARKREETKELDALIQFWKDSLAQHRRIGILASSPVLMSPSTVYLVEQTIKSLEELKQIKEGEVIKLDEDQASLFKEGN